MSAVVDAANDAANNTLKCWCCGYPFAAGALLHLGDRPEVTVCFQCAHDLDRRATRARERGKMTPGAMMRRGFAVARGEVIRRGWHRAPLIGAVLRNVDRHLP